MLKETSKKPKGFTLVELLVVIAIIGLLSSLSMMAAISYRDKARDARIETNLSQVRTVAARIDNEEDSYAGLCDDDHNLNRNHPNPDYGDALGTLEDDIERINGGFKPVCYTNITDIFYCVRSSLATPGYLCVDSTGYIGKELTSCDSSGMCY